MIFALPNPIPLTVTDPEDLTSFFDRYDIVPYYGTSEATSHNFLDLLTTLTELSPTFTATRADLVEYTFGTNFDVAARTIPGLVASETTDMGFPEKEAYVMWLKDKGIKLRSLIKTGKTLDHHLDICGNAYLHIRRVTVGGTTKYYTKALHYKHTAYVISKDEGIEFLIHSKFLGDLVNMRKYPPAILPVSDPDEEFQWASTEPGIEETVIHLKRGNTNNESDYYARPRILSTLTWLYTDYQIGNLNSKIAATELVSKKILAFEQPDPNRLREVEENSKGERRTELDARGNIGGREGTTQFQRNMMVLKELTTNLGSHASSLGPSQRGAGTIAGIEYPRGEKPPVEISLEVNRDTKHHQWQAEQSTAMISAALRWAPELTAIRAAKATLGGNLLYDIFTMKNTTTIRPRQVEFGDLFNNIFTHILERDGGPAEYATMGLELPDIISEMVGNLRAGGAPAVAEQNELIARAGQQNEEEE